MFDFKSYNGIKCPWVSELPPNPIFIGMWIILKKKWVHVPVLGKSYIFYKLTILHILSYPLTNRNKTKNWSLFSFSFLFLLFGIELDANRK